MNQSVTYLKAFGIILMVLGHTMTSLAYFSQFIAMFHMPLFFFISGYCFKRKYLNEPKSYLFKKVKSIYWPYLKWSVVFLACHNLFFHLNLYNASYGWGGYVSYLYEWPEIWHRLGYIVFLMTDHEQLLGGYWFMSAMFFGTVVAFLTLKLLRREEIAWGVNMAVCFAITYFELRNPFYNTMLQAFYTSTFILTGMTFAKREVPVFPRWAVALSLVLTFTGSFFWAMSIGQFPYVLGSIIPFFVTAVLATWSFYSMFTRLNEDSILTRSLTYIGKNTLTILTWHLLSFKMVSLLIILVADLQMERLAEFPVIFEYSYGGWWLIYAVVALLTTCGIAYLNRYIKSPWLKL